MNCTFTLTHENLVAATHWTGDLNYEIIAAGITRQNQWILENSSRLPLVLISDFTDANLSEVTGGDLERIADKFQGADDLFPDMTWIAVMPKVVKYDIVRLWLEHSETMFRDAHVVKNQAQADTIITDVLERFAD